MATMNISLPDPMRDWVESQVKGGQYSNNSDYVRDLIRRDERRAEKFRTFQQAITKGFNSGNAGMFDMNEIKQEARKRGRLAT